MLEELSVTSVVLQLPLELGTVVAVAVVIIEGEAVEEDMVETGEVEVVIMMGAEVATMKGVKEVTMMVVEVVIMMVEVEAVEVVPMVVTKAETMVGTARFLHLLQSRHTVGPVVISRHHTAVMAEMPTMEQKQSLLRRAILVDLPRTLHLMVVLQVVMVVIMLVMRGLVAGEVVVVAVAAGVVVTIVGMVLVIVVVMAQLLQNPQLR